MSAVVRQKLDVTTSNHDVERIPAFGLLVEQFQPSVVGVRPRPSSMRVICKADLVERRACKSQCDWLKAI